MLASSSSSSSKAFLCGRWASLDKAAASKKRSSTFGSSSSRSTSVVVAEEDDDDDAKKKKNKRTERCKNSTTRGGRRRGGGVHRCRAFRGEKGDRCVFPSNAMMMGTKTNDGLMMTKETVPMRRDRIRAQQKDRRKRRSNRAGAGAAGGGEEDESNNNMYDASEDEEPNFGVKPPELATFHRKTALFAISVGFAVFYGFPKPDVLTSEAWQLLAIFAATICGLVLKPLPVGAWAFGAMTVSLLTKTLTFEQALSSVSNQVVWLILVTAFFARAFVKTGFGDRLALLFVSVAGQSSLRLAYGFQFAEALLSPAMPSTTARA